MTVKDLVRPLPGVRGLSLLRQRAAFHGSAAYWEKHYSRGGDSGDGSYGLLAEGKAAFLNSFVRERGIRSVIEFGCGDGNQLSLADYPRYTGLDVSRTALAMCCQRFADDPAKSFFLYDGECFVDHGVFSADLALSLDVIYHLTEDRVFETYLGHLFASARRCVIVYATDTEGSGTAPHVRRRRFTPWAEKHCPQWRLTQVTPGPGAGPDRADFHVYEPVSAGTGAPGA